MYARFRVLEASQREWREYRMGRGAYHTGTLLPALQKLVFAKTAVILGVALSGAGPSVLIFLDAKANVRRDRAQVETHLRSHGLSAELITTAIAQRGAAPLRRGKARLS